MLALRWFANRKKLRHLPLEPPVMPVDINLQVLFRRVPEQLVESCSESSCSSLITLTLASPTKGSQPPRFVRFHKFKVKIAGGYHQIQYLKVTITLQALVRDTNAESANWRDQRRSNRRASRPSQSTSTPLAAHQSRTVVRYHHHRRGRNGWRQRNWFVQNREFVLKIAHNLSATLHRGCWGFFSKVVWQHHCYAKSGCCCCCCC